MARKAARWIGLAVIVGAAMAWWRSRRQVEPEGAPPPVVLHSVPDVPDRTVPEQTTAEPVVADDPVPVPVTDAGPDWVEPIDDACPDGYPVKVNERSGIYHVPGGLSYDRTRPTRCYATAEAAEADGFRRAKR